MPQNRTCDFCGADIDPGTGTMFVRTDGSTVHYCSAKCEKNADLGREPRDVEWTETARERTQAEEEARAETTTEEGEPEEGETEDALAEDDEAGEVEADADEPESDEETAETESEASGEQEPDELEDHGE